MKLQLIPHSNIDFQRWDTALQQCVHKLIYAESVYLNTMCGTWNAVVNEEWTMLMPIPIKRKLGFEYVPIIPFIQQLGIFYHHGFDNPEDLEAFIAVLKQYKLVNYNLNYGNTLKLNEERKNYVIPLARTYETIKAEYKTDFSKYLKGSHPLTLKVDNDFNTAINLFESTYANRMPHVQPHHYQQFKKLLAYYQSKNKLSVYSVFQNDELLATAVFLQDEHRVYNIASVILPQGKKVQANHFLYDSFLQLNAGQHLLFDLEGSDIEGIAHFYKNMGGQPQHYAYYEHNHLPWLVNWLRKLK